MLMFVIFVSAGVSIDGAFSLWVSLSQLVDESGNEVLMILCLAFQSSADKLWEH